MQRRRKASIIFPERFKEAGNENDPEDPDNHIQQSTPFTTTLFERKAKLDRRQKAWEEKQKQLDAERLQLYNDNIEFQKQLDAEVKAQQERLNQLLSLQTAFK